MNNKLSSVIKFASVLTVLVAVTFFTWAMRGQIFSTHTTVNKAPEKEVEEEKLVYDPELIKDLKEVCATIDATGKNYFISGLISSVNELDKSSSVKDAEYVFCKEGNEFYYKLDSAETMNGNGMYLFVDHTARKVILSPEKKVIAEHQLVNLKKLTGDLESEGYSLTSDTRGGRRTLTLLNEYHITCKQYSITYDTISRQPVRVYCRLTNIEDPLRKDNEQVLDVRISEISKKAVLKEFFPEDIVVKVGKEYKLSGKYKEYDLLYGE